MLDRIDIHIEVPRVDYEKLSGNKVGELSETIRQRVQAARDIQKKRFANGEAKGIILSIAGRRRWVEPVETSDLDAGNHE
ncbi:MAG: hypothetical protein Q8L41_07145 [Anaerolineales bacterium]|nr:hypothetical protein [Anaerolineales bacterium]